MYGEYRCQSCGQHKNTSEGVWRYTECSCSYRACPSCIPRPPEADGYQRMLDEPSNPTVQKKIIFFKNWMEPIQNYAILRKYHSRCCLHISQANLFLRPEGGSSCKPSHLRQRVTPSRRSLSIIPIRDRRQSQVS